MASNESPPEVRSPSPRYQPLVVVLVAVCLGIVADRYFSLPLVTLWLVSVTAGVFWLALWWKQHDRTAGLVLLAAVAATAAGWHHCRWNLFAEDDLGHYAVEQSQPACVEAIARSGTRRLPAPPPDPMRIMPRGDRTRLEVTLVGIRDGATWKPASGDAVLIVDGHLLGVHAGDRLRVFANLASPRQAKNPGDFNYADHLRADRVRSVLRSEYPESISVLKHSTGWSPGRMLHSIQTSANEQLWRYLDHRQSGLAAALLLGNRTDLDASRIEAFQTTGTIHLMAISGLHVAIVAMVIAGLARLAGLSYKQTAVVVALAAIGYTILTDARPPAVRTSVLVVVMALAVFAGRRPLAFNSLAAAALVILLFKPADLFRVGPQLSFLAVAALMWFGPRWLATQCASDPVERLIERSLSWSERLFREVWQSMRHLTLVSALIWLITLPLIMARFNLFTPAAVVLNTVLWVPVAFTLASGLAVFMFGWACPPLAMAAAWVCDGSLGIIDGATQWVHRHDIHFWVPGPGNWWLVGFYGGLGVMAAFPRLRPPPRWVAALLLGWVGLGFGMSLADRTHPAQRLECTFLSMGHGCATVLQLPSGGTMLYDAGCFTSPDTGAAAVAGVLWSRGIRRLDAVVISHADADHYNALPELLERFSVGVVYVSPRMFDEPSVALDALRQSIEKAGVPIRTIHAGSRLHGGPGCRIDVLHPPPRGLLGNDNANSLVLCVEFQGRRILLAGDLESPGLEDVLVEEPMHIDILLVPHHGSRHSNPPGLAAWCTPDWAIISGSVAQDPTSTENAYHRAGARVLHTGRTGAVRATIDSASVRVETYMTARPRQ
ncbi:MAG: ComEC/Rec2 family competence protein [Pirellulales bacterium]|nr:ComEC/Rec2 family competence protein [Pirellulales bacterium]